MREEHGTGREQRMEGSRTRMSRACGDQSPFLRRLVLLLLVLGLALPPFAFSASRSAHAAGSLVAYGWGTNDIGQVGDGTTTDRSTPVQVKNLTDVQAVSSGEDDSLALDGQGHVWAWGANSLGQLGNGDSSVTKSTTPVEVVGPGGTGYLSNIIAIAAGQASSLALASDGTVYAWGWNLTGVLGVSAGTVSCTVILPNDTPCSFVPLQVSGLDHVVKISIGDDNPMALESDGSVWVWGDNVWGELANGATDPDPDTPTASFHPTPRRVDFGGGVALDIATANATDYALIKDCTNPGCHFGTVYAWGHGFNAELGNGTHPAEATAPGPVQAAPGLDLDFITSISAGSFSGYAIDTLGFVLSWGASFDALGHDATDSCAPSGSCSLYPSVVLTSNDPNTGTFFGPVKSIDGGGAHAFALTTDGTFWSWGGGPELGLGPTLTSEFPAPVLGPEGTGHLNGVTAFSAGGSSLAVAPPLDTTPPLITPHVSPAPNGAGWNTTSPVSVSWYPSDPESGIASSTGCGTSTVSSDTTGTTFTCSATNGAGLSASQSVTVMLDTTAPQVTCPAADGTWHGANVTLACTVSDATSGLAAGTPNPVMLSTTVPAGQETANAVTGSSSVCDVAGNCSPVGPIAGTMIDRKSPTVVASATSSGASYSSGSWTNHSVVVHFACSDGGSGVASVTPNVTISTEGAGQVATGSCTDNVGNAASAAFTGIQIDRTPPSVTYNGNAGTYTVADTVTITCSATDALSGIAGSTCTDITGPAYSFGPGSHTFSASATDKAGNSASASTTFTVAVTFDSLCTLVRSLSSDSSVADSLCTKLAAAKASAARGDSNAEAGQIGAFKNQVAAQTGKAVTAGQAQTLTNLANALM